LWYRHPGVIVRNRVHIETPDGRLAIDVRGDGGFVIAPGSVHASGVEYRVSGDGDWNEPRARLPVFSTGWLQRPTQAPTRPRTSTARPTGDVIVDRARRYLAAIPRPEIGAGSDAATFYAASRLARGFDLAEQDVVMLLWEWAGSRPGWTREWVEDKVGHAITFGTEPIGALR
jgi:hypothetical protein